MPWHAFIKKKGMVKEGKEGNESALSKYREKVYRSLTFVEDGRPCVASVCDRAIGLHRRGPPLSGRHRLPRTALWSAINFEIVGVKITRRVYSRTVFHEHACICTFGRRQNSFRPDIEKRSSETWSLRSITWRLPRWPLRRKKKMYLSYFIWR